MMINKKEICRYKILINKKEILKVPAPADPSGGTPGPVKKKANSAGVSYRFNYLIKVI